MESWLQVEGSEGGGLVPEELIRTGFGRVVVDLENGGGGWREVFWNSERNGLGSGGGGGILTS